METKSTSRVLTLMESVGLSQVKFAERCGIRPSNFNRALKSEKGLSPQYLLRIAHAFNVNFEWLRKVVWHPIAEGVTVYTARYTFASIGAELEIPRETIALCLGHSWADVTDHYIAYGTKRIDDAVRKIIDYVNSDKA